MSSSTDFLKLFKWNTSTDGSQKFNIDKALNENWDKVETNAKAVDDTLKTKADTTISPDNYFYIGGVAGSVDYIAFEEFSPSFAYQTLSAKS